MGSYATLAGTQNLIPRITIGATTVPTTTQATALVAGINAALDAVLRLKGYTLPVTDVVLTAHLAEVGNYGAAAAIIQASPAGQDSERDFWEARYTAGVAAIGPGGSEAVAAPERFSEGFTQDTDGVEREVVFTRDMTF